MKSDVCSAWAGAVSDMVAPTIADRAAVWIDLMMSPPEVPYGQK